MSKVRNLSLALVAALALSATAGASAASAAFFTSTSENGKTIYSGINIGKHWFIGETLECGESTLSGQQEGAQAEYIIVSPTYSKCKYGATPITVTTNGCGYRLEPGKEIASGEYEGSLEVQCPAGSSIEIKSEVVFCKPVKIPPQKALGVIYRNQTEGGKSVLEVAAEKPITLTYKNWSPKPFCMETATLKGWYFGRWQVSGFENIGGMPGAQVNVFIS